jgi:two-component system alkaline phosphatase synthesis response regulator PhoP
MIRILVVEDEPGIAFGLKHELVGQGYSVDVSCDGHSALECAIAEPFDLILLDITLPKKDGYSVCRELRRAGVHTPIMMLTARGLNEDKVKGLDLGADDYLSKPFDLSEVLARVRALLRRSSGGVPDIYKFGDIEVDFSSAEVRRKGALVELTPLEFKLLATFVQNRRHVLTRDRLLSLVWADRHPIDRVIDNHIVNLRLKIEPDPRHPIYLITKPGFGYRFDG